MERVNIITRFFLSNAAWNILVKQFDDEKSSKSTRDDEDSDPLIEEYNIHPVFLVTQLPHGKCLTRVIHRVDFDLPKTNVDFANCIGYCKASERDLAVLRTNTSFGFKIE